MSWGFSSRAKNRSSMDTRSTGEAVGQGADIGFECHLAAGGAFANASLRISFGNLNRDMSVNASAAISAGNGITPGMPAAVTASMAVGAMASVTPSWVSLLSTPSISADISAAIVDGTVSYSELLNLLTNLDTTLSSSNWCLAAATNSPI